MTTKENLKTPFYTDEKFLSIKNELSIIHNNKYFYNDLQNICKYERNTINCLKHGLFNCSIIRHKRGTGCAKCAILNKTTPIETILEQFKKAHGDRYDYSLFKYINAADKSIIICKVHGEFLMSASTHRDGTNCPSCMGNKKYTTETFKAKFYNKFPESKLLLDNIKYINADTKIEVICTNHPENIIFNMAARLVLSGASCPRCCKFPNVTLEDFINRANKIHNFKYDYSLVNQDYVNVSSTVKIICNKHKSKYIFKQKATSHIHNERGCSKCTNIISKPETAWLESFNNPNIKTQITKVINNRRFRFDGFDPNTNTIYEFYGDYWHGNPDKFDQDKIHPIKKLSGKSATFGEIYKFTIDGEEILRQAGYSLISIWESEFNLNIKQAV